ncbi:MAG: hypothetical protein AVDCRST_MAG67-4036, partial [uncultured Solirubrobacteraceae bacterium]
DVDRDAEGCSAAATACRLRAARRRRAAPAQRPRGARDRPARAQPPVGPVGFGAVADRDGQDAPVGDDAVLDRQRARDVARRTASRAGRAGPGFCPRHPRGDGVAGDARGGAARRQPEDDRPRDRRVLAAPDPPRRAGRRLPVRDLRRRFVVELGADRGAPRRPRVRPRALGPDPDRPGPRGARARAAGLDRVRHVAPAPDRQRRRRAGDRDLVHGRSGGAV